jgi:uncharacterized Zn-finger protein
MPNICEYCKNTFSQKQTLIRHQKTAKFCLELQKEYSGENNIEFLKEKLKEKDQYIKKLEENISILQNKLENIAIQSIKRPSNVTNNTNIISLQPLTKNWLNSQACLLSKSHVEKGILGYAEFAKNHSLKDRVKCIDFSRKKLQYIQEDGTAVKDNKGNRISKLFFESIQNENEEIVKDIQSEILRQVTYTSNPVETMHLFEKMNDIINISKGLKKVSQGESDALKDDFVRELCNLLEK